MLKALLRVRLAALLSMLTGSNRSKKQRSRLQILGFAVLMLYAYGFFAFFFYNTFGTLGAVFHAAGLDWLFFAFAALMEFGLMFVGSVFSAKTQLYESGDNDLLLSMPLRPGHILLSRMFMLWMMNLLMALVTAVPALIAWIQAAGADAGQIALFLLVFFLLQPLLALAVSAVCGWLLHRFTARMRRQSAATVLLSLAFLAVYIAAVYRIDDWLQAVAADPSGLAGRLGAAAPLRWIGLAVGEGRLPALALVCLCDLGAFALCWLLLSRSFIRTATDRRGAARIRYVEKDAALQPLGRALLQREFRRFGASPSYILNGALGAIMAPVAAVVLLVKSRDLQPLMADEMMAVLLPALILLGLCFMAGTTLITAPSLSLEGRTLWILRSLPVEPRDVLLTKLKLHLAVALPTIPPAGLLAGLALGTGPAMTALMVLVPAAFSLLSGLLGLFENLRHPNFDWINETQAVKSGASILLTMFISYGLLLPPLVLVIALGDAVPMEALMGAYLLVLLALSLLLWRWLMTRGVEKFRAL